MDLPALGLNLPWLIEAYFGELMPVLGVIAAAHVAFVLIKKSISWAEEC